MPKVSGLEVLKTIKTDEHLKMIRRGPHLLARNAGFE